MFTEPASKLALADGENFNCVNSDDSDFIPAPIVPKVVACP